MHAVRALPLYVLLLAACSEPPKTTQASDVSPGVNCQDECASGFRWAIEREITDEVKCRGEGEFGRGCREAVAYMHPFARN